MARANGRFLFVHKGSVIDPISVDCREGRLMASLGVVKRRGGVNGNQTVVGLDVFKLVLEGK